MQTIITMTKEKSEFGWGSLWRYYGFKGLMKDICAPIIISIVFCVGTYLSTKDPLEILKAVIKLANEIVPAMIGLVLASYTILLTFFTGDSFQKATNTAEGKKLIKGLNANFAVCLTIQTVSIISSILISICIEWEYTSEFAIYINIIVLFFVSFLLSYAITSIFGMIIDIYNSGQTTALK